MRVLYLAKFELPYRTENYVTHALKQEGCSVIQKQIDEQLTFAEACRCAHKEVDFVLFSKSHKAWFADYLKTLRLWKIPSVCWQWDLFHGYRRRPIPQFQADIVFTTDGGHSDGDWRRFEVMKHNVLRQGIHEPEAVMLGTDYLYDVAFYGTLLSRRRRQLITWLTNRYGPKFYHGTHDRGMDLNRSLSKVKIIVGENTVDVPNYWSNRVYEITGRGGFLLHAEVEGMENEYSLREVARYKLESDFSHLQSQIEYYLENTIEREKIRIAGFNRTRLQYTYRHRVRDLLSRVQAYMHLHA